MQLSSTRLYLDATRLVYLYAGRLYLSTLVRLHSSTLMQVLSTSLPSSAHNGSTLMRLV